MIIKNVSGETRYFGSFGPGVRGRVMANNATSTVPDNNPVVAAAVQAYVNAGILQVTSGPSDAAISASITTPAFAYVCANGAVADADTVTVAGVVYEFANDPGSAVLGAYNSGLSNAAYKWAGDGAAAATAIATLRTAINYNTATSGLVADAAIQYISGKYVLPIRRADGSAAVGSFAIAKSGTNLTVSGATLTAGVTGAAVKNFSQQYAATATDVTNAVILIPTGLTSIATVRVSWRTAAGVAIAWDGALTVSGGNVTLNNVGSVDFAATDIATITVTGN